MSYKPQHIPGIDSLRALAVLSVILFHVHDFLLPGGFTGVDVFFVISGYVVTGSLLNGKSTHFREFIVGFYARRFSRIYPVLLFFFLVVVIAKTLLIPRAWLSLSSEVTGIASLFGMGNFALVWFSDGYFSNRVDFNVFTHTWSLGVEEQFYLLYPIIVYLCLKGRDSYSGLLLLIRVLLALALVSLFICWWETSHAIERAYYFLPARFWELAVGGVMSAWHSRRASTSQLVSVGGWQINFGCLLVCISFFYATPSEFPFPWALVGVAGTLFVINGLVHGNKFSLVDYFFKSPVAQYIGKISYSLYLWHWPVIVVLRWTWGDQGWLYVLSSFVLTLALGVLSYHLIERKLNYKSLGNLWGDGRIVVAGFVVIFAFSGIGWFVFKLQSHMTLSVTGKQDIWYSQPSTELANIQSEAKKKRLFVLGDSHVGAYSTMLAMLEKDGHWDVLSYYKAGCSMTDLLRVASNDCRKEMNMRLDEIIALSRPGDHVFLASLRMNRLGDQWSSFHESDIQKTQELTNYHALESSREATDVIQRLERAGLVVIIDAPKPVFRSPPFRCSDWFNQMNPVCNGGFLISRDYLERHRKTVMSLILEIQKSHPNVKVWDAFPLLCSGNYCQAFENGYPLFFDGDHLSGYGNKKLYPYFANFLGKTSQ